MISVYLLLDLKWGLVEKLGLMALNNMVMDYNPMFCEFFLIMK